MAATDERNIGNSGIENLDRSTIIKIYSGKPGCGCGCLGTHFYNCAMERGAEAMEKNFGSPLKQAMITRTLNTMIANKDLVGRQSGNHGAEAIYFLETDARYYWVTAVSAAPDQNDLIASL